MSRLDDLRNLAARLDQEIRREEAARARLTTLLEQVHVAVTRGTWNTRCFTVACHHFDVTGDALLGRGRDRATVDARHVAMWLMRDGGRPYAEIGRELGVDHSTVIYAVRRVNTDEQLLATAQALRSVLTESSGEVHVA